MTANVVVFPRKVKPHTSIQLAEETIINFPFSLEECAIINAHLRARSPELLSDIECPVIEEVIERFVEHVWRKPVALAAKIAPALIKTCGGFLYAIATTHTHSWGYVHTLSTHIIPRLV